jgi:Fur family ferric uptake transcriptional regulator
MADSETWQETLRAGGYRLTPQRELVLTAVDTLGHATPDQVYAEVRRHSSAINLSTVYRTLELLDELGLIRHAHIEERTPTYHSTAGHEHFHLVCHRCRNVISLSGERIERFRRGARRRARVPGGRRPPDHLWHLSGVRHQRPFLRSTTIRDAPNCLVRELDVPFFATMAPRPEP